MTIEFREPGKPIPEWDLLLAVIERTVATTLHEEMMALPNYDPEGWWPDERLLAKAVVRKIFSAPEVVS